jgi:metallo-beta-lactamase class B
MFFSCAALKKCFSFLSLVLCLIFTCNINIVQAKEPKITNPEWEKPYKPFRIVGNLYYVGSYDLAAYLITTPQGHILINTGVASSANMIKKNVETLGFKITDVKILLTNQAHYDHMGGMAAIQKISGAQLMADEGDVAVIQDGGNSDYIFGGHGSMFKPVKVDRILHNNDEITLGDMTLTILHHPGHTKGACSYLFTVKDEQRSYKVLVANIPTMLEEADPTGMPTYPDVAKDFEYTYGEMPKLKFDLWFAAHASQFDLHKKHNEGDKYNPNAFADRKGYDEIIKERHEEYLAKKAKK